VAASKDKAKLYDGADPDKPDPKVEAQAAAELLAAPPTMPLKK
jgi:hypothetical protein